MKKILVFAGSSSSKSINLQLAKFAASLVPESSIEVLNLNDFEMPIYSSDREEKNGIPELAKTFLKKIEMSDTIFLSLAEHNGAYTTAFKNIMDWTSRIGPKIFFKKSMLLMATSPGPRGGMGVLTLAKNSFPFFDADIKGTFSLPEFYKNFKAGEGIINSEYLEKLKTQIKLLN